MTDFDPRSVRLNKEFKAVIDAAERAGWSFRKAGNGGVRAMSPSNPAHVFYLPITTRHPEDIAKNALKLIHNSAMTEDEEIDLMRGELDTFGEVTPGPAPTISCRECSSEFTSWEALSAHVRSDHSAIDDDEQDNDEQDDQEEVMSNPAPTEATLDRKPHLAVVNTNPTTGVANFYESETTIEVSSGGEVVWYECAHCGEKFEKPESVSPHYNWHIRRGEATYVNGDREIIAVGPSQRRYRPKVVTSGGLERDIYEAIRLNARRANMSDSVYARTLADAIQQFRERRGEVEFTSEASGEVESASEASGEAEVILAQIRDLVGADVDAKRSLAEAEARAQEAEDRAQRAEQNIQALRELLAD